MCVNECAGLFYGWKFFFLTHASFPLKLFAPLKGGLDSGILNSLIFLTLQFHSINQQLSDAILN